MRAFRTVPVVDIDGLFSERLEEQRRTAEDLGAAARDVGFLYITGHRVDPQALKDVRLAAESFFARPLEEKMSAFIGRSQNHSGYAPEGEEWSGGKPGKKETFDFGPDYRGPDRRPMLGPNLWPADPALRGAAEAYYAAMSALAGTLFSGFALALGLPRDHFSSRLTCPPSQQRLIHYPFNPDAVDREGVGAHTDYECFTILASTAPGLEVMNDQGEWIDAPPMDGAFVINIGEMLETWTNGAFVATSHRVRAVKEERYSFPFFAALDYDTVVRPLPAFVTEDRPAKYPPMVCGEHIFSQTVGAFRYLRERQARGEIVLSGDVGAFGREARLRRAT